MIKRMLVWAVMLSMMLVPGKYVTAMESETEITETLSETESIETVEMSETSGENDNAEIQETMEEIETIEMPAVEIEEKYESLSRFMSLVNTDVQVDKLCLFTCKDVDVIIPLSNSHRNA